MAFKNEVVSDADIDRYNLPFQKGDGRWWTRDADRDYYLWGGLYGIPAFGSEVEGKFYLYVDRQVHLISISLAEDSERMSGKTFLRKWQVITQIVPEIIDSDQKRHLAEVLKEALLVYGFDGQDDGWLDDVDVHFAF